MQKARMHTRVMTTADGKRKSHSNHQQEADHFQESETDHYVKLSLVENARIPIVVNGTRERATISLLENAEWAKTAYSATTKMHNLLLHQEKAKEKERKAEQHVKVKAHRRTQHGRR